MAMGGRAGDMFCEINVTPLTDVFLVLLVIMILIAPLVNQTVLKVDPPNVGGQSKEKEEGPKISVDVDANGTIKVNGAVAQPPDTSGVARLIQAEQTKAGKKDLPLNLQSDADAQQKFVVAVMDAAAGCEIKNLHILPLKGGK